MYMLNPKLFDTFDFKKLIELGMIEKEGKGIPVKICLECLKIVF